MSDDAQGRETSPRPAGAAQPARKPGPQADPAPGRPGSGGQDGPGKTAPGKGGGGKPPPNRPGKGGQGGQRAPAGKGGQGNGTGKGGSKGQGGQPQAPVPPPAAPAHMKTRHWGLTLSFVVLVLAPFAALVWYLWFVAEDQYTSVTGFTVRQEEGGNASQILGGLAQLTGAQSGSDGEILYEFILSQSLVRAIEADVGLSDHYTARWSRDPVFALWPDPSIEDLEWYWGRVVRVSYDPNTGLTELRVSAFTPEKAQDIARAVVDRSQEMINALNEKAREDAMRYAREDLEQALARLKAAREALTAFRSRTQIVDPEADLQGRMGVMNNLQQQLAEALIEYDLVRETTNATDPRVTQAARRITVIRERIADERESFATQRPGDTAEDYPSLIAEYEGLVVDREFAEETYRAALAALDLARAQAQRQSRYLATYIDPTLAEDSTRPDRPTLAGLAALVLLLTWAVLALIFYAVRDRA
mgnify:CR=1 FL=1